MNDFNELFIDFREHPLLAELTDRFHAVDDAHNAVVRLVVSLKRKRGERINSRTATTASGTAVESDSRNEMLENIARDLNDPRTRSRERVFEVAKIRVELANSALFHAIADLHVTIASVRSALDDKTSEIRKIGFNPLAIAQNNVVSALELADAAAATHYETVATQLNTARWHYFAIKRTFESVDADSENAREWVVMASGHGSRMRFDGSDPDVPPPAPYMTLGEAIASGRHWEGIADTIGGGAQVYNVRTKETRGLYR